ncbi:phospholipid-binding protein MlaC [Methylobacterium sp. J-068]|uniref:MlaC/ttg2D family ABC transporter substrate-binding protein n=1 Tax=Methylobacterium sp. J-068 TaxID=2836649 RepID=UPI001FB86926|nr:ABC transporter substrate-binding protein [Methylobacterium sp. J-068]MCJ2033574.1 ABC transporter substrate-binding protein [Methylobacterium sp. J-068]
MRLKRVVLAGLVAGLLQVVPAAHAADDPAVAAITKVYGTFETALKESPKDVKARAAGIGPTLNDTFDFPAMVRVAVGPKWKTLTPEQQGALTEAFGRYFTATYATRLAQAAGGKFTVKPQSDARGPNRVVQTEVANKDGDTSQVDFLVNPENRVQDVYLNGNVSEVASLRGSFAEPLKTGGADGLLNFMRDRTTGMLAVKPAP